MASHWSYDPAKFASTAPGYYSPTTVGLRYQLRLVIQDTTSSRQLFQDEELDLMLSQEANIYMAAVRCCDLLIARMSGPVRSRTIGDLTVEYDTKFYESLKTQLIGRGSIHQQAYAGGLSIADKQVQQRDTDAVQPAFARGVTDNPSAPKPNVPSSNPLTTI